MEIRNSLYDAEVLKSSEFNIPVISVGNLSIGGAGKTPQIEYLVRLLKDYLNVAILSRGYKRSSKGFRMVTRVQNVREYGDEPTLYKIKYKDVAVAVSESRAVGIPLTLQKYPATDVMLLDDAFQHRSVKPGLNILLTEFQKPFTDDIILPAGRLRESRESYKRADIIIVSKCPNSVSEEERQTFINKINPLPHQKVFFSYYQYFSPYQLFNSSDRLFLSEDMDIILLSAIANTEYLESYLSSQVGDIKSVIYEDHHYFTDFDISRLKSMYENMPSDKKYIITTEKDAVRLLEHRHYFVENKLAIYVLPIAVKYHFNQTSDFDTCIKDYLLNFKV